MFDIGNGGLVWLFLSLEWIIGSTTHAGVYDCAAEAVIDTGNGNSLHWLLGYRVWISDLDRALPKFAFIVASTRILVWFVLGGHTTAASAKCFELITYVKVFWTDNLCQSVLNWSPTSKCFELITYVKVFWTDNLRQSVLNWYATSKCFEQITYVKVF